MILLQGKICGALLGEAESDVNMLLSAGQRVSSRGLPGTLVHKEIETNQFRWDLELCPPSKCRKEAGLPFNSCWNE